MLAAASMSGCRRDNPAWLRATDVGTSSLGGTESDSGASSGETGEDMSGSDSEGEIPFEDRICLFTFSWDTNLTDFFPGLGDLCGGNAQTIYFQRTVDDELELFEDSECLVTTSMTSGFHPILIGSLSTGKCYRAEHETELVSGDCETEYAVVRDPDAPPGDPPALVFSRRAETPAPLVDSGIAVEEGRTHVCTNCNDSKPSDGLYSPSCCGGEVERVELRFTLDGQTLELVPGPESDKTVTIGGKSRQIRVLASERVWGEAMCSEATLALEEFALENIAWVID